MNADTLWITSGLLGLLLIWLWFRLHPIVISVIGFDWEHEGILFKEAARKASRAIGRRVVVKPINGGVGVLLSTKVPTGQLRVPSVRLSLAGSRLEKEAAISDAIRVVVGHWETRKSTRLLF
jgi:hypothetical protein